MRLIIVPSDTFVSIDGVGISGVAMTEMPSGIHAVQFYDDNTGEIEWEDGTHEPITDVVQFNEVISAYNLAVYRATPPSRNHVWDDDVNDWVEDIATTRRNKRMGVDALRDEKLAAGVPYTFPGDNTGTVQTRDLTDHRNIQANASAAQMYLLNSQPTAEMQFRDMEDVVHTLTATEMIQMCSYVMGYGQAIYSASWAHKEAIDALTTVEAVEAYDVTTGWPV